MRTGVFLVALFAIILLFTPTLTVAQEEIDIVEEEVETEIEDPGILPDSPFYGFKVFGEKLRLMITFNRKAKIRLRMKLAERRLAEAEKMTLRNKTQLVNRLMTRYQAHVGAVEVIMERLEDLNVTTEDVDEWMNKTTNKHIYVLRRVIQRAPAPAAQAGLQRALNVSERNQQKIKTRLIRKVKKRTIATTITAESACEEVGEFCNSNEECCSNNCGQAECPEEMACAQVLTCLESSTIPLP